MSHKNDPQSPTTDHRSGPGSPDEAGSLRRDESSSLRLSTIPVQYDPRCKEDWQLTDTQVLELFQRLRNTSHALKEIELRHSCRMAPATVAEIEIDRMRILYANRPAARTEDGGPAGPDAEFDQAFVGSLNELLTSIEARAHALLYRVQDQSPAQAPYNKYEMAADVDFRRDPGSLQTLALAPGIARIVQWKFGTLTYPDTAELNAKAAECVHKWIPFSLRSLVRKPQPTDQGGMKKFLLDCYHAMKNPSFNDRLVMELEDCQNKAKTERERQRLEAKPNGLIKRSTTTFKSFASRKSTQE